MKWYWYAAIGVGAWWLFLRKPAPPLVVLGGGTTIQLTPTVYDELIKATQSKYPNVTNIAAAEWGDGSMTFTGQTMAPDGQGYVTIKLFDAKSPDEALAYISRL